MSLLNFISSLSAANANNPDTSVPSGTPSLSGITTKMLYDGSADQGWSGRTAIKVLPSGVVVLMWASQVAHDNTANGVINISFSNDYGATWTAKNKYLDNSDVTNFPFKPAGWASDESGTEPWMYIAPNGNLVFHTRKLAFPPTSPIKLSEGTWQMISSDGGKTWGTPAKVDFQVTVADDNYLYATDDDFTFGNKIYAAVRHAGQHDPAVPQSTFKMKFMTSDDNATSWDVISDICDFVTWPSHEAGIEYIDNNTIYTLLRAWTNDGTYTNTSNDLGATWQGVTDLTPTLGATSRHRIYTRSHLKKD
jgi:hypothetical protein